MTLHILKQISAHLLQKLTSTPKSHPFRTSQISIIDDVLYILDAANPMEDALNQALPYFSSETIVSVLQKHPNAQSGFRFFIWACKQKQLRPWKSSEIVINKLIKDSNGFASYWEVLEELKSCQIAITSDAFTVLIAGYGKAGMTEKAVEAFGRMREFDCEPDVFAYNSILHVLLQKEMFLLVLAVYNKMLRLDCNPDKATYSILIHGFCKFGKTGDALKLFDEMTMKNVFPNEFTYTIILSGLCQEKKPDDARRLLDQMKSNGCRPDSVTYNALLNGFCKMGKVDEAFELLKVFWDEGYTLGVNGYSSLIDCLFKLERYKEALHWYQKMLKSNVKPDVVFYTTMIQGFSGARRVHDALQMLKEMTEKGILPDARCYNVLIRAVCHAGLLDEARSLQLEISKSDCFPDTCTYTILICGMCRYGLVKDAQQIFGEMENHGCFPSVVSFNALMDGLCKARKLEEAQLLFYKMEIGRNPSLFLRFSQGVDRVQDVSSLQLMVDKLCMSGSVLKAYRLLRQLADSSVVPNLTTYNILINGMCRARDISGAFKLLNELQVRGLSPDSVTYGTLVNGLFNVGRDDDAFKLFRQMTKNGCTPGRAIYNSFMTWSCRNGNVLLAFNIWLEYLRRFPDREGERIKLVEEQFKGGEVEKAIRGLLEMDLKLNDFDLAPYAILLVGFCKARRVEDALKIFAVLEEFGINVTPSCCVAMIHSLFREGKLQMARDAFLYTLEKGIRLKARTRKYLLRCLISQKDKAKRAMILLNKIETPGYRFDSNIRRAMKNLLNGYKETCKMEKADPG